MSDVMANNKATAADSAFDSASGKAFSRARRAAMSSGGKAGLGQVQAAASGRSQARTRPAETVSKPASALVAAVELPESACGCKGKDGAAEAERANAIEEICSIVANEPGVLIGPIGSAVRQLCQQRRQALSSQGKTAVKSFRMMTPALGSGLSGRAAARTRRAALCENGRGDDPACRPSGRVRPESSVKKVGFDTTLSGNTVSGSELERKGRITGVEFGSCRVITGTEYVGAEQYGALCESIPPSSPAKVGVGMTGRGQRVSGVDGVRGERVTGTEVAPNKAVTGNEYLSVDKFEASTTSRPAPAKVGISTTRSGKSVSGTEVGHSIKVTGDEHGSCLAISGNQYIGAEQSGALCASNPPTSPAKVGLGMTGRGQRVSGVDAGRGENVTGTRVAANKAVTGNEYLSVDKFEASATSWLPPAKVGVSTTRSGMGISGTEVGRSIKVTGDERGSCSAISGIQYSGSEQFDSFCDATQQAASRALLISRGARAVSGIGQMTKGKITGAEKGADMVLSGTPYSSTSQRVSERGANTNPHPLTRSPVNIPRESAVVQQMPTQQGSFSVVAPARSAQQGNASRISGTAYGSTSRVTGPVNLANGLVSGTPEFRYHDDAAPAMAPARAEQPQAESARNRMTGDGREGGFAITGAAWRRNEHVTGTEGNSTHRNPTIRGENRSAMQGAAQMKERERAELPISKITGSSGTDMKGSSITYSGGARG